jgi:O-antigen/teichoic acid export membrane protein
MFAATLDSMAAPKSGHAPPPASFRANVCWMLGANVLYGGSQWAVLAIVARLGTPVMVGQYVLALAVTGPVMAFFMLQLRAVQATDAQRRFEFGHYLALRLLMTGAALVALAGASAAWGGGEGTAAVIVAVSILAAVDSLTDVVYGLLQQRERLDRIAQSMLLRATGPLGALVAMRLGGSLPGGILAIAAVRLAVLLAFDVPNAQSALPSPASGSEAIARRQGGRLAPRWEPARLRALAVLSLPLGLVMMLLILNGSIPRLFVAHDLDQSALGVFGVVSHLTLAGGLVVAAVGESISARLARLYAQAQRQAFGLLFAKSAGLVTAMGAVGIAVAAWSGPFVLTTLYGADYGAHGGLLVLAMAAAACSYLGQLAGYALTSARYFGTQIPLLASVAATSAIASWWLVPLMGVGGAVLAQLLSALAQLIGSAALLWHAGRMLTPDRRAFRSAASQTASEAASAAEEAARRLPTDTWAARVDADEESCDRSATPVTTCRGPVR